MSTTCGWSRVENISTVKVWMEGKKASKGKEGAHRNRRPTVRPCGKEGEGSRRASGRTLSVFSSITHCG